MAPRCGSFQRRRSLCCFPFLYAILLIVQHPCKARCQAKPLFAEPLSGVRWPFQQRHISLHYLLMIMKRPCILEEATLLTWSRSSPQTLTTHTVHLIELWAPVQRRTRSTNWIISASVMVWLKWVTSSPRLPLTSAKCCFERSREVSGPHQTFLGMASCWVWKLRWTAEPQIVPISGNSLWQLGFLFLLEGILLFFSSVGTNLPVFLANENPREDETMNWPSSGGQQNPPLDAILPPSWQEHCWQPDFCNLPCPEDNQPLTSTSPSHTKG